MIALNMFAAELENAVGGIIKTLDTNAEGTPVVVYNPVSYTRNDVVVAELDIQSPYVRVFDCYGKEVPAQISTIDGKNVVKFIAKTAPVSCRVYDVRGSEFSSAVETNGYEDELGAASFEENILIFTLTPYVVKTFALTIDENKVAGKTKQEVLNLPYNKKVTTNWAMMYS